MAKPQKAKQWILIIDSINFRGEVDEFNPPKISKVTEDHRAGDMLGTAKVALGYEALEFSFKMKGFASEVIAKLAGDKPVDCRFICASQREDGGSYESIEWYLIGGLHEGDQGSIKAGELNGTDFSGTADYVRHSVDDFVKFELDINNMVEVSNGVDIAASLRAALGLSSIK